MLGDWPYAAGPDDQGGDAMRKHEFNAVFRAIEEMSWSQRRQLIARLKTVQAAEEAHRIVEERLQWLATCPQGCGLHVVRNGVARGLQRHKCRDCGRTFNALPGTPLAELRYRERWLGQAQVLIDGRGITKASRHLEVARSTAFRWRHRLTAHLAAVLQPGLAADAVLCPDGSGALADAARHLQIEHHAINTSGRQHC